MSAGDIARFIASQQQQARCPECNHLAGDWTNSHEVGCAKGLRDALAMANSGRAVQRRAVEDREFDAAEELRRQKRLYRERRSRRYVFGILAILAPPALYGAWLAWVLR